LSWEQANQYRDTAGKGNLCTHGWTDRGARFCGRELGPHLL